MTDSMLNLLREGLGYVQAATEPVECRPMRVPDAQPVALLVHADPRGALWECWRESWAEEPEYDYQGDEPACLNGRVRQVYLSITHPDTVKGWHLHLRQTDRFTLVRGRLLVGLCDLRPLVEPALALMDGGDSPGQALDKVLAIQPLLARVRLTVLNATLPSVLVVPPLHAHGWLNAGTEDAWVLNMVDHEYDGGTDEWRLPADHLPYSPISGHAWNWRRRMDG